MQQIRSAIKSSVKYSGVILCLAPLVLILMNYFSRLPVCAAKNAALQEKILASDQKLMTISDATSDAQCSFYRDRYQLMLERISDARDCGGVKQLKYYETEARAFEKLSNECKL